MGHHWSPNSWGNSNEKPLGFRDENPIQILLDSNSLSSITVDIFPRFLSTAVQNNLEVVGGDWQRFRRMRKRLWADLVCWRAFPQEGWNRCHYFPHHDLQFYPRAAFVIDLLRRSGACACSYVYALPYKNVANLVKMCVLFHSYDVVGSAIAIAKKIVKSKYFFTIFDASWLNAFPFGLVRIWTQ